MSLADRRSHPRHNFRAQLLFTFDRFNYRGNCQDLSEDGLGFMAGIDIPVGSTLTLYLLLIDGTPPPTLEVIGAIRWRMPVANLGLFRYGVNFQELPATARKALAEYLDRLGPDAPAP